MYGIFKKEDTTALDKQIEKILLDMDNTNRETPEYAVLLTHLERLNELKTSNRPQKVSLDTIAVIAGNLAGILIIVAYEQKHVITSKGLGQLLRIKNPTIAN